VLKPFILAAIGTYLVVGAVATASAQTAAPAAVPVGRLTITVVDQTGAVLPTATVTVLGQDAATKIVTVPPGTASDAGILSFEGVAQGRYTLQVDFPGFETATVRDVRVRAGDTRRTVTLQLKRFDQEVTVGRDGRTSGLDPRGNAFSTVLTREMIEALPDDPDEMEAVLKAMSPGSAQIRIDGFSGGRMPPKSQIRSIRLPRMDAFAAQNHGGMSGMSFIDIMTQPGAGSLRGNVDLGFQDSSLNARNPFTPVKGDEQQRRLSLSLSGNLKPNRTSFSVNLGGASQYTSPNQLAVLPDGSTVAGALRTPSDSTNVSLRLDHSINKDHTARLSIDRQTRQTKNQGVSGFNLADRAYKSENSTTTIRMSENGPFGRRMFSESRLQLTVGSSSQSAAVEAPTIRVLDAFTTGGAQVSGGQRRFDVEASTELDYVRGAHSSRFGLLVEGGRYRSDDVSNYLGTYTFASIPDYLAGLPMSYTRKIGDPNLTYARWQAAAYAQDDWRVARTLMLSGGVRFGVQSLTLDQFNISPRINLAWSPLRSGNLTMRAGYGYFYDWLSGDLYKQTLQIDGFRQRELNVRNPSFPAPPEDGPATATNQYLWSDDLALPTSHRLNVGADRTLTPNMRVNATFTRAWGRGQLRGRNLNTPVNGVRPNAEFANILTLVSDAESQTNSLNLGWNYTRLDWKRAFFFVNYTLGTSNTNTTGAFSVPASGDNLVTEWGPSQGDIRHRANLTMSMAPFTNLSMNLNARVQSGSPYNITTGRDDNGDGLFNDRPVGVARNAGRASAQWDLGGRMSYTIGWGSRAQNGGGPASTMVQMMGGSSAMAAALGGGAQNSRYRLEFSLSFQNLLNRANYVGYSGVITSPFYGKPTSVVNPRSLQLGARLGF